MKRRNFLASVAAAVLGLFHRRPKLPVAEELRPVRLVKYRDANIKIDWIAVRGGEFDRLAGNLQAIGGLRAPDCDGP